VPSFQGKSVSGRKSSARGGVPVVGIRVAPRRKLVAAHLKTN
jgi:hypothetical protein